MWTNGNKSALVVVEYGFWFAPGLVSPSADVKASRLSLKTPPIPKRLFNDIVIQNAYILPPRKLLFPSPKKPRTITND
jgi:hypothetical protein